MVWASERSRTGTLWSFGMFGLCLPRSLPGEPIPRKRTQWTRRKWLKDNYGAYLQLEGKHKQKLINVRFRGFEDKKNISIQELSDQYWSGIACCEHDSTKESTEKNNTLDKENPETRCAYWQLLDATTRQVSKVRQRAVPNFKWPDICLDAHTNTPRSRWRKHTHVRTP